MEELSYYDGLTDNEEYFIQERDSFYMASIGENGFPYIQHRGGPKGFVKVLDKKTIGFLDFRGNMQYITRHSHFRKLTFQNHQFGRFLQLS
jgi:predicted pyridoxine 5'-phosphate oxidase superfamily flavin-nucleotide-binding protein